MQRATAFAVTLMYLLATSRALIPGLCATQTAIEERAVSCCTIALGGCESSEPGIAATVEMNDCAFCHLAKAPNTLVAYANTVDAPEAIDTATDDAIEHVASVDLNALSAPRAPPLPLA